jgi:FixJ family two-component response regulator
MLEAGCLGYLSKPFDDEVLIEYIGSALRARGSDRDLS